MESPRLCSRTSSIEILPSPTHLAADQSIPRSLPSSIEVEFGHGPPEEASERRTEDEATVRHIRRSLAAYSLGPPSPELDNSADSLIEPSISPKQHFMHMRTESAPAAELHRLSTLPEGVTLPSPTLSAHVGRSNSAKARRRAKTATEPMSDSSEPSDADGPPPAVRPRHTRRSSLVPGLELGSAMPLAAPPAARPISVSIRPSSICEEPGLPNGFFANHVVPAPSPASLALARTSSQQSSNGAGFRFPLLKPYSSTQPIDIGEVQDPLPPTLMPASPILPPPQSPTKAFRNEELESDSHPLYRLLSRSLAPRVRAAWQSARLVLIPPTSSLPHDFAHWADEMEDSDDTWQSWLASHAFKPVEGGGDPSKEIFTNATGDERTFEAILDSRNEQVHVGRPVFRPAHIKRSPSDIPFPLSPPLTSPLSRSSPLSASPLQLSPPLFPPPSYRTLPVLSETVVYRQTAPKTSLPPTLPEPPPSIPRKEKSRIRAPKWLRAASLKKTSAPPTPDPEDILPSPTEEPVFYQVRLLAVGGEILPWRDSDARSAFEDADEEERPSLDAESELLNRGLLEDLAFFLSPPPALANERAVLLDALQTAIDLCRGFSHSYLPLIGHEQHTLKRIHQTILLPIWHEYLEPLASRESALFRGLENVVMGLLHDHLYTQHILPSHERQDCNLDAMLAIYRARELTLEEFNVRLPADLDLRVAFGLLRMMGEGGSIASHHGVSDKLADLTGDIDMAHHLISATTPLDILVSLRRALKALIDAANEVHEDDEAGSQLTTDDFIPLLSFALTMSGAQGLESILFYVSNFVSSKDLGPEYQWTLSTFASAVHHLRTNPHHADLSNTPSASPSPAVEQPPAIPSHAVSRPRHHTSLSTAGGPILSVHQTSSPPRRTASATSLPGKMSTAPTSGTSISRVNSRLQEATLGPSLDAAGGSSLYSRRLQSGRHVPSEISAGIDVRPGRSQSMSEEGSRRSRTSPEEMPPPSYPASSRSVGPSRIGSRLSLATSMAYTPDIDAEDEDALMSAHSGSVILQPPTPDVEVRPQIILRSPVAQRQPSRSYHHAVDFDLEDGGARSASTSRPHRAPLGRANSHVGPTGSVHMTDMRRSRSDGQSRRPQIEGAWTVSRSPVSEGSTSPRSVSPSSNGHGVSLERTLSIGSEGTDGGESSFFGSARKRLSSVTSCSASMFSLESLARRDSQPDKDVTNRHRRDSVSAADILHRLHTTQGELSSHKLPINHRRRSTLSLCSMDSEETTASGSASTHAPPHSPPTLSPTVALPKRGRRHSTRGLRRDLMGNGRALPSAPRVDNANVLSVSQSSSIYGQLSSHARFSSFSGSLPSPIREGFTPSPSTEPSPVSERSPILERTPSSMFLASST